MAYHTLNLCDGMITVKSQRCLFGKSSGVFEDKNVKANTWYKMLSLLENWSHPIALRIASPSFHLPMSRSTPFSSLDKQN